MHNNLYAGLVLLLTAALFVASEVPEAAAAQQTKTFTITPEDLINAGGNFFDLTFAIGGARLTVEHIEDSTVAVQATVTYDDLGPAPKLDISSGSSSGFVALLSSGYDDSSNSSHYNPFPQSWHVVIGSYGVPTGLTVAGGGIETNMDLGGMPLRSASLALGGVAAFIDVSTPTTLRVENFEITGGGLNLGINNIANTDFQRFSFIGGGVRANLDFRGAYTSPEHSASIIGAGSLISIAVPKDAGESLAALSAGGLTMVLGRGWRRFPLFFLYKNFETTDYGAAAVHLDFELLTAGALVTVNRK